MTTELDYMVPKEGTGEGQPQDIPSVPEYVLPTPEQLLSKKQEIESKGSFGDWLQNEGLQTSGSFLGSVVATLGSRTPAGMILRSAAGAGGGGAGGKAVTEIIKGSPTNRVIEESLKAGATETTLDLVGSALFKSGSAFYQNVLKPKTRDKDTLTSLSHKLLARHGGQLTASHVTESQMVDFIEATARGAAFGGKETFERVDLLNKKALQEAVSHFSSKYSNVSALELSERGFGEQLKMLVDGGHSLFKEVAHQQYGALDTLVKDKTKVVARRIPTVITNERGRPITRTEMVEETIPAVDVRGVKNLASKLKTEMESFKKVGVSGTTLTELNKMVELEDRISFTSAHEMRSALAGLVRDLSTKKEESKLGGILKQSIKKVEEAMSASAKEADVWDQYKNINAFYRTNKQIFRNNTMVKMLGNEENLHKLGDSLYTHGNYVELEKFKTAFRQTEDLLKKHPSKLKGLSEEEAQAISGFTYNNAMKELKTGYLSRLFKDQDPTTGEVGFDVLNKVLSDKMKMETMRSIFSPKEVVALRVLNKAVREAQGVKEGGVGGIVRWAQVTKGTQAVQALGTPLVAGGAAMAGADLTTILIGTTAVELTPQLMGKLFTNPDFVTRLAKGTTASMKTPKAGAFAAKLLNDVYEIANYGDIGTQEAYETKKANVMAIQQQQKEAAGEEWRGQYKMPSEEDLLRFRQAQGAQ